MQTTIHTHSRHPYEEIIQQVFGKNITQLFRKIGNPYTGYTLHILGCICLLFLFSIRIHIPHDSIGNTEHNIGTITQKSVMKNPSNTSMMDPIPDFGYELKGNSYSYPIPFFE